jgi:hypothetical protein
MLGTSPASPTFTGTVSQWQQWSGLALPEDGARPEESDKKARNGRSCHTSTPLVSGTSSTTDRTGTYTAVVDLLG